MSIEHPNIEMVALEALEDHPRNVHESDVGAIHESIGEFGFYGVVVAQRSTRHVLAGHGRRAAAKLRGLSEVPVQWLDVDDTTALRILLGDNRIAALGLDRRDELAGLLAELATEDEALLIGTGWDGDDLSVMLRDKAKPLRLDPCGDLRSAARSAVDALESDDPALAHEVLSDALNADGQ